MLGILGTTAVDVEVVEGDEDEDEDRRIRGRVRTEDGSLPIPIPIFVDILGGCSFWSNAFRIFQYLGRRVIAFYAYVVGGPIDREAGVVVVW